MRKLFLISFTLALISVTQAVYAVTPKPPRLKTPDNLDNVSKEKLTAFEWDAPSNAADAKILNYRFIITSNSAFGDYDKNKKICSKNTCFTTLVNGTKLPLSPKLKTFLTVGKKYFWQVQALNKESLSRFSGNTNTFNLVETALKISNVNVSPESAVVGSKFTFSSTLTTDLPKGYSVQIDYGNGLKTMTKTADKNAVVFSYTAKLNNVGSNSFDVVLHDKNNAEITTDGSLFSGSYEVLEASTESTSTIPSINEINVSPTSILQGNSVTFSANLNASLPSGYSVKVDYGSGLIQMSGSGTSFNLTAMPNSSAAYKIGIYDSSNTLRSNQLTGNFSVAQSAPVVTPTVIKTTGYTKIANNGSELSDDAKLGTAPSDWACTKDNNTGLIWEVKTDDGGLRDKDWTYSWYEPDEAKNGGNAGKKRSYEYANWCKGSECDINDYTQTVNESRLCGAKDWRIPSKSELVSLIYCSDEQYDSESGECVNSKVAAPTIDKTYFPNTAPTDTDLDSVYWTFSTNPMNPEYASNVIFTDGTSYGATKIGDYYVRLVRNTR